MANSDNILLSVIIPAFNEKQNLLLLLPAMAKRLANIPHEIIIVDDNSPDGTAGFVRDYAQRNPRLRVVHRYGRRGLASAVVEGIMASCGEYLAVMDADLQHDESKLVTMYQHLRDDRADVVVGSRFLNSSPGMGLSKRRQSLSKAANRVCNLMLPVQLSDPMSGFFMLKRNVFHQVLPHLSPMGFKILFDLIASFPGKHIRVDEIAFDFRKRQTGTSKLDSVVIWEFCIYLCERLLGKMIPGAFISFACIGCLGIAFHLIFLYVLLSLQVPFVPSHIIATSCTIVINFSLNNALTYSSNRLSGWRILGGLCRFYMVCGLGAFANVGLAAYIYQSYNSMWLLSAIAGIIVGSFWNFGMSRFYTWGNHNRRVY